MASSASDQPAVAAKPAAAAYSTDPALYIYTSLTAGSSHIVTATSRLETILRANRIPFKALDIATDEKARMLWGRRAGKDESGRMRKLPGLVQEGLVLGDLVEIEEWNEYGELKQHVKIFYDDFTQPSISQAPKLPPVQPKPAVPAAAASAAVAGAAAAAKAAIAAVGPKPPPPPPAAPPAAAVAKGPPKPGATTTLPVLSVAEQAAAKAKQIRLQSLRDKVYGKGNSGPATAAKPKEGEAAADEKKGKGKEAGEAKKPAAISLAAAASRTDAGLQSPTTGAWTAGNGGLTPSESLFRTLQSPTSTAWKPTDVDPPVTSHRGSVVSPASPEEIEAIERELTIKEEPEEEDEEEEEEEEDDSEDEDSDDDDDEDEEEEEEPKKPAAAAAAAAPAKSAEPPKEKKAAESKGTKA